MKALSLAELFSMQFQAHPWHGIPPETDDPLALRAYIEMGPDDRVKKELNKRTGLLEMDRVSKYAAYCPTYYGFIPQTYCGDLVAARCRERTRRRVLSGDLDPLDVCILTENRFIGGETVHVVPIGGLAMIDKRQADDKIVCVIAGDLTYGGYTDISQLPPDIIPRLENYFLSYKRNLVEKSKRRVVSIAEIYGAQEARHIIDLSRRDYESLYGSQDQRLEQLKQLLLASLPRS